MNNPTSAMSAMPTLRPYQQEAGRAIVRSALREEGRSFSVEIARRGRKNELSDQIEAFLLVASAGRAVDAIKCAPTFRPRALIRLHRLWARLCAARIAPQAVLEEQAGDPAGQSPPALPLRGAGRERGRAHGGAAAGSG